MDFSYLQNDLPLAFAHRGGNIAAPENTVAAFEHAVSLGYRYLETDVHRTRDGVLVAFHDAGLDRVAGLGATIAENTWSELQDVDLGDGHSIPTMDELFERFPGAKFNIDPKADDAVDLLGDAIESHNARDRVCVGSFSDQRVTELQHRLGPKLCTSPGPRGVARLLAGVYGVRRWRQTTHGCLQIPTGYAFVKLSAALVKRVQATGLQVHVWTINEADEMHRLYDMGVDGVMTDNTALLRDVLVDRDAWPS